MGQDAAIEVEWNFRQHYRNPLPNPTWHRASGVPIQPGYLSVKALAAPCYYISGLPAIWRINQRIKNEGFQLAATGTLRKLAGRTEIKSLIGDPQPIGLSASKLPFSMKSDDIQTIDFFATFAGWILGFSWPNRYRLFNRCLIFPQV